MSIKYQEYVRFHISENFRATKKVYNHMWNNEWVAVIQKKKWVYNTKKRLCMAYAGFSLEYGKSFK